MTWLRKKAEQADCQDCGGIGRGPGGEGTTCESCDGAGQVGGPSQHGNPKDSPLDQLFVNQEPRKEAESAEGERHDEELAHEIGEKAKELEHREGEEAEELEKDAFSDLPIEGAFGE